MNQRLMKEIEKGVNQEILTALEESTEAEFGESTMSDLTPPPRILELAARAATAVVMAWKIMFEIAKELQEEA